jgi:hypothetical protein
MKKPKLEFIIDHINKSNMHDRDKVAMIAIYTKCYEDQKRDRSERAKAAYRAKVAKRPK